MKSDTIFYIGLYLNGVIMGMAIILLITALK